MASNTVTNNSIVDEDNWVVQIDKMFRELDLNYLRHYPVCIYNVPKSLSSAKPEAFTPQLVALGPYHHFRPELYPMERFKLIAAKRVLNNLELSEVVKKLSDYGPQIRACYHKYIDFKDDTLIYTMIIDTLFLLDLLQNCAKDHQGHIGRSQRMVSLTKMDHQVHTGMKLTKDAIIRDVLMLENQIPTCMLRKMIMAISNSEDEEAASQELGSMLLSFCHALSPLPLEQKISEYEAGKHVHLLDLMYYLVTPPQENNVRVLGHKDHNVKPEVNNPTTNSGTTNSFKKCLEILKKVFGYLGKFIGKITSGLNHVPFLQPVLQPVAKVLENVLKMLHLISASDSELIDEKDGPVAVTIPSVTELHDIGGVHFRPSKEKDGRGTGIKSIRFDEKKRTFYLPEIKLDVNTEVIMRNLVAYEALTKSESLLFTRYTELMKAIVDTVEDVKLLRGTEIIKSNLKDKEAEELFNGMSKSIGPTRTLGLEKEIAKVNKYFNNTDKVKAYRLITKYVYSSWKLCTLFVTFVLLGLMVLQTLCSVYDCPRILKTGGTGTK